VKVSVDGSTSLPAGSPWPLICRGATLTTFILKQETVSGSGIGWAICNSATHSRQITMPAPHHCFLQAGCLSCRPNNSVKALKAHTVRYSIAISKFYYTNEIVIVRLVIESLMLSLVPEMWDLMQLWLTVLIQTVRPTAVP